MDRCPAWNAGQRTVYPTPHDDTALYLLFPVPAEVDGTQLLRWTVLDYLITAGDLGSPLNRIVREESQLAYSPEFVCNVHPDGGYWGLAAQTSSVDPEPLLETFYDVLRSPELRSAEWFDFVGDTIRGGFDMHDPSPGEYTDAAADQLTNYGCVWSDPEMLKRLLSVGQDEIVAYLDGLDTNSAHEVVFAGGSSK